MTGIFTPRAFVDRKKIPWPLILSALLLSLIGVYFIRSAHSLGLAAKQGQFLLLAVFAMVFVSFLDLQWLASYSFYFYALGLLSLVMLPIFGVRINNAVRWYDLVKFRVQPSEFVKLALVLMLAEYFRFNKELHKPGQMMMPFAMTVAPMMFIVRQPDLGTSLLFLPVFFGMAFIAGARVKHLVLILTCLVLLAVSVWFIPGLLKPYQRQRVEAYLHPDRYVRSPAGYNSRQAVIAITTGGLRGRGWGQGVLNRLRRIPERHTDFIFPVIAEEWGFIRTVGLILLYGILLLSIYHVASSARDPYGRLVASGVMVLLATQGCLHMAISLRLAPITGLTLPLISYGGSSLLSTFLALGLVVNVAMNKPIIFASQELKE